MQFSYQSKFGSWCIHGPIYIYFSSAHSNSTGMIKNISHELFRHKTFRVSLTRSLSSLDCILSWFIIFFEFFLLFNKAQFQRGMCVCDFFLTSYHVLVYLRNFHRANQTYKPLQKSIRQKSYVLNEKMYVFVMSLRLDNLFLCVLWFSFSFCSVCTTSLLHAFVSESITKKNHCHHAKDIFLLCQMVSNTKTRPSQMLKICKVHIIMKRRFC